MSNIFVPLPVPGATIDDAILKEHRKRGILNADITAFHALDGFAAAFGGSLPYLPIGADQPKRWSDTGNPTEYLTMQGMLDAWDMATWSDFSMVVYGRTVAQFYQDYAKAKDTTLRWIPRFIKYTVAKPALMNFVPDYKRVPGPRVVDANESPYPLAKVVPDYPTGWSWPTNHAIRMNPQTQLFEAFHIEDYMRQFPIKTTVSTDNSAAGAARVKSGQSQAFLAAAAQGYFSGNYEAAAADVISKYVEVK